MEKQYGRYKQAVEDYLAKLWADDSERLVEAMRYSLLAGGKRIRPVLALAFCEMFGGKTDDALHCACAIELIHTYSLIHDDLPCMDNDNFRRGRPSNHKAYDCATALLAGDGLLSYAQLLSLSNPKAAAEITLASFDMVRGQALEENGCKDTRLVNRLKTGALFRASARTGCIIAGANEGKLNAATAYADALGLAFQYRDDMLDSEADCQSKVELLTSEAKNAVLAFENSVFLCEFADWLCDRSC